MLKRRLGFTQQDNAFTALDDPQAAQKLADTFVDQNWRKILNRLVCQANALMRQSWFRSLSYYWVVDQAEFSTDLIFTSREALAGLYPRLLDHAAVNFSAKDILSFLGRRFHPRFDGEVLTHCQKGRWPGARIKHRMKNNWLKMYDKFALVLRIETVINNPREFRVRRLRTRDGRRQMVAFSRADPEQSGSHRIVHPPDRPRRRRPRNQLPSLNRQHWGNGQPQRLGPALACSMYLHGLGKQTRRMWAPARRCCERQASSLSFLRVRRGRIFRFFLSIDRRVYCGSSSP